MPLQVSGMGERKEPAKERGHLGSRAMGTNFRVEEEADQNILGH